MEKYLEGREILLVDDEDQIRLFLRKMLTRMCPTVTVREAGDGEAALRELSDRVPDLVVLDLDMPKMRGPEVLEKMRSTPGLEHVPVLVLTGGAAQGAEVELIQKGASDFTHKPVERTVLLARVGALLRAQAHVRQLETRIRELEGQA